MNLGCRTCGCSLREVGSMYLDEDTFCSQSCEQRMAQFYAHEEQIQASILTHTEPDPIAATVKLGNNYGRLD